MNNDFELEIIRQHWIKDDGLNDKADLCSHGIIYLKIGNEILSHSETAFWTTSAAGLHLMRTLYSDYNPGDFAAQLIPCCGHFMTFNEDGSQVDIHGCPNGIDWRVYHSDNTVQLITEKGSHITIPYEDYRKKILDFVNDIESFYGEPGEKIIPNDELEKDTFEVFWHEWNSLKTENLNKYI